MAFLYGRPLLILTILGIHLAYGCEFVSPPNRQDISEVVNDGQELFTIEVDGQIDRIVTNPASVHSKYISDQINGRTLTYTANSAALAEFYDEPGRTADSFSINELVVYCVGDTVPATVPVVRVYVKDENNKAPEFDRPDDSFPIDLPWGPAPINWASPITVTDGDFEEANTDVTFTTEPQGIISITSERSPPSPGRLNYYKVFYTLDPNYDQSQPFAKVVTVKASDGPNEREYLVNLTITPAISPPTVTEEASYHDEVLSNTPSSKVAVAKVADNGGIDALNVQVIPADNFNVYIEPTSAQVILELREEFDPNVLAAQNYIVRLTLKVSDATSEEASLPLAIKFESITVKAELGDPGYVSVTKSEPGRTLLKVSATPTDNVVYEIEPKGKLVINVDGEISSEHSDDEIVGLDGQVEVVEVTVKRLNIAEVKLKVAVVYQADPSLITTTTSTTETPVTCPTITEPPECTCPTETPVTCSTTTEPADCTCPTVTTETPVTCPTTTEPADCTCPTVTTETPVTCPATTEPADCVCSTIATETATPCPTPPPCPTDPAQSTCTPCDCTTGASSSPCEPCTTTVGNTAATDPSSTTCPPLTCLPCDSSTAFPVTGGSTPVTGSSDSTCPPPTDCSTASPVTGGPTPVTGSSDSTCPPPTCPPTDCSTASPVTGGPTAVTGSSDSTCTPCDCSTASPVTDGQTVSTNCPVVTCPPTTTAGPNCPPEDCTTSGLIAGVAVASTIAVVSAGIAAFLAWKAWSGVNVFKDLITTSPKYPDPEVGPKGTGGGSIRNAFENGTVRSNFNGSLKGSARNGVLSNGFGSVKGTPDTGDLLSTPNIPETNDVTYQNDSTYDTTGEYSYANPDPDITTSEMTPDASTEVTKSNNNNNDSITQPELPPETDPPPEEPKPDYNRVTIAEEPPTVIPDEPAEETIY